jgi:hypothetical protein
MLILFEVKDDELAKVRQGSEMFMKHDLRRDIARVFYNHKSYSSRKMNDVEKATAVDEVIILLDSQITRLQHIISAVATHPSLQNSIMQARVKEVLNQISHVSDARIKPGSQDLASLVEAEQKNMTLFHYAILKTALLVLWSATISTSGNEDAANQDPVDVLLKEVLRVESDEREDPIDIYMRELRSFMANHLNDGIAACLKELWGYLFVQWTVRARNQLLDEITLKSKIDAFRESNKKSKIDFQDKLSDDDRQAINMLMEIKATNWQTLLQNDKAISEKQNNQVDLAEYQGNLEEETNYDLADYAGENPDDDIED